MTKVESSNNRLREVSNIETHRSKFSIGDKVFTHIWEEIAGTNISEALVITYRRTPLGTRYFVRYMNYKGETRIRPRMWWRIWK